MKKNNLKTVITSFIFGMIGACLILCIFFKVPSIKNVLQSSSKMQLETFNTNTNASTNLNNHIINVKEYSDTSTFVASKVLPSVVGITVEFPVSSVFSRLTSMVSAEGSGIIISENGYILTNNHIVSSNSSSNFYEVGKANKVNVYLYSDETPYEAQIIGTDKETDLAVIKIDKDGLTAAEIGDSDILKVGEFAMTIGNPLGFQSSVCTGVISAINRKISVDGITYKLIQTDAAINSGNSGGALVNSNGQIVGINTLKISSSGVEGIGFAIPINSAKPIYEQLIEYKKVKRPQIGIEGKSLSEKVAKENNLPVGVYVLSVKEFSSAEKAGIKIGDVILSADDEIVKTIEELNEIKNKHSIGDIIKLKISRDGIEKQIEVKLQE